MAILASDSEREMSYCISDDRAGWGLVFQSMDIHWPSLSKLSNENPKFSKSVSLMLSLLLLLLDISFFICSGEGMAVAVAVDVAICSLVW